MSAAIATLAVTAYSAYSSSKSSDKSLALAGQQGRSSAAIAQEELALAREKWNLYKTKIMPMELEAQRLGIDARELAQRRGELDFQMYEDYYAPLQIDFVEEAREGVKPQVERVTREAGEAVEREFERGEQILQRDLERRGVRPDAGAYRGAEKVTSLAKAAARAGEMTAAKERELDRAEDISFSRKGVVLGRQPGAYQPAQTGAGTLTSGSGAGGYGSAASTLGSAAARSQAAGQQYAADAAATMRGGINLASQVYDRWGGGGTPTANPNVPVLTSTPSWTAPTTIMAADGGQIPTLSRGGPGGEVRGPGGVDNVPGSIVSPDGQTADVRLSGGEYVMPNDVVMAKGTDFFDKMIEKHHRPVAPQAALSRRIA